MVKLAAASQRPIAADPSRLLSGMNSALFGNTQEQFVTAAYVHLNAGSRELRYSAAGHPPMLLLRKGEIIEVKENGLIWRRLILPSIRTPRSDWSRVIESYFIRTGSWKLPMLLGISSDTPSMRIVEEEGWVFVIRGSGLDHFFSSAVGGEAGG